MVKTQKKEMKLLQNELCQLKAQLQMENVVVDVLSNQVASRKNNMDLQCENKQLKLEKSLLIKKINNNDYLNLLQLQEKTTREEDSPSDLMPYVQRLTRIMTSYQNKHSKVSYQVKEYEYPRMCPNVFLE